MEMNFTEIKKRIEILEKLDEVLKSIERDTRTEWGIVNEEVTDIQDTHWKTGELLWQDDEKTIPKFKVNREWDYIPKIELDDEDKMTLEQVEQIRKVLRKMV